MEEMVLEDPEIVRQGSRYGVRLRASAPSIHIECIKQKCIVSKRSRNKEPLLPTNRSDVFFYS